MLSMKRLAVALALTLGTVAAKAAPMTTQIDLPITEGHWMVGGGGSWTGIGSDYSDLNVLPQAEYFLMDRLSVGGAVGLYFSKNGPGTSFEFRTLTFAPSASYYFYEDAGMAFYVNQQVRVNFFNNGSGIGGKTGAGVALFLNNSIAITPEIQVVYGDKQRGSLNLVAMLSAYL